MTACGLTNYDKCVIVSEVEGLSASRGLRWSSGSVLQVLASDQVIVDINMRVSRNWTWRPVEEKVQQANDTQEVLGSSYCTASGQSAPPPRMSEAVKIKKLVLHAAF